MPAQILATPFVSQQLLAFDLTTTNRVAYVTNLTRADAIPALAVVQGRYLVFDEPGALERSHSRTRSLSYRQIGKVPAWAWASPEDRLELAELLALNPYLREAMPYIRPILCSVLAGLELWHDRQTLYQGIGVISAALWGARFSFLYSGPGEPVAVAVQRDRQRLYDQAVLAALEPLGQLAAIAATIDQLSQFPSAG